MPDKPDNIERRFEIEGQNLGYPTSFREGSSSMGLFVVPASVANDLIFDGGFQVAKIAPGRAILVLSCVHYTDSDCGAYNEIALSFFVKKHGRRAALPYISTWIDIISGNIASYTWRLPVTSNLARDAGIYMWGFPKTTEDIDYENVNGQAVFTWSAGGKTILSYCVRAKGKRKPATISPPVYSIYEGQPHVSYLTQDYSDVGYQAGGGILQLGDNATAEDLRSLGLPKKPMIATWNGHLSFEMSAPEML